MRAAAAFLASRWLLSLLGTVLLAGLVWYFGPLLPAFDEWPLRAAAVGAMLVVWFALNLVLDLRRLRQDAALAAGITSGAAAAAEETRAVQDKLATALRLMRKRGHARLYEQPWYAIIGPPGAGKTTALLNAGLSFPLAEEMGQGALAGVGGTRLCDWWFTEEAVMIDTAGRYTTQDSDAAVDRAGWEGFLDLLKRTRARQPLNGVIIAIALSDIALASPAERRGNAQAIRKRVRELETRLGVRLPIYVLFTKADLLAGFTEFFDDLDRDARDQVWGATFPIAVSRQDASGAFAGEFRTLVERLNARLFQRLADERSPERRALIAGFPAQVASLEQPLTMFLQEAFSAAGREAAPLLRGAYLTSGTQEGTPIDRLTGALSRAFGLDQRRAPSLRPEQGRSYFLGRLLRGVVFHEAMLVSDRPGARRRRVLVRGMGFAAIALVVLAAGGVLWRIRATNQAEIDRVAQALDGYGQSALAQKLDPVSDGDLRRLAPLLAQARDLPFGAGSIRPAGGSLAGGWLDELGLGQAEKLAAASRAVYRHALERALLPRLVWRLEAQLRGNLGRPDYLYEAMRVYLMLGGDGPLDRELVRAWLALDWQDAYPGLDDAPLREELARDLDALMAEPMPPVALDGAVVAQARETFARVPVVQRVYSRLKPMVAAARLPAWRPLDAVGAAGATLFSRASGKPLDDGIPGLYTVEGFHKALLPSLDQAIRSVSAESWVLGRRTEVDLTPAQVRTLEHDVIAQYEADYAKAWDTMLGDLNVVPMRSIAQAAQDLFILGSPQSPMRALLLSITRQLTLSKPPNGSPAAAGPAAPAPTVEEQRLRAVMGTTPAPSAALADALPPGHEIDERYKALRDAVGSGPGARIDTVVKSLVEMQQSLAKIAASGAANMSAISGDDPAVAVRAQAAREPPPLSRWLTDIAAGEAVLRGSGSKQQTVSAFNASGGPGPACAAALKDKYPFVPGATADLPLDDFAKLFAPGGLLDAFFTTQLKPYVAISGNVWKPQAIENMPSPVTAADLAQFQRAAAIRALFFAAGGSKPGLRFDLTPVDADSTTKRVTLDLDGTVIAFAHGPPQASQITWSGSKSAKLTFDPPAAANTAGLQESGPWAMLRLFGHGQVQPGPAPDVYTVTVPLGDRKVVYEIKATPAGNPVAPASIREFRCPTVQ